MIVRKMAWSSSPFWVVLAKGILKFKVHRPVEFWDNFQIFYKHINQLETVHVLLGLSFRTWKVSLFCYGLIIFCLHFFQTFCTRANYMIKVYTKETFFEICFFPWIKWNQIQKTKIQNDIVIFGILIKNDIVILAFFETIWQKYNCCS